VEVFTNVNGLQRAIDNAISADKIVGLVPTMGALHQGHLTLVKEALKKCDVVVVSIFVNPTQFTENQDYNSYPRTPEADIALLKTAGCNIVFLPDYKEIYPVPDLTNYDFGYLENVLEGKFRPGHFKGVAMVVRRLFEIVKPHRAYFGLKDFQQVMVIKELVRKFNIPVQIVGVPTVREKTGLAMSSRNQLLNEEHRHKAVFISEVLNEIKTQMATNSVSESIHWAKMKFLEQPDFELEYLEIVDANSLQPILTFADSKFPVALIAARLGKVRLIDNLELS
jgi:pantoate--beta-alanine ligase